MDAGHTPLPSILLRRGVKQATRSDTALYNSIAMKMLEGKTETDLHRSSTTTLDKHFVFNLLSNGQASLLNHILYVVVVVVELVG